MKVLFCEDDVTFRLLVLRSLKKAGCTVTEARNGEEAVQRFKEGDFDAVVTDWMMPKVDGIELIRTIRAKADRQPFIVMVTAISSAEGKRMAMDSGADAILAKPIDPEELVAALRSGTEVISQGRQTSQIIARAPQRTKKRFFGVGIASSTGGPQTLLKLFKDIPPIDSAAFMLVQHGPAWMLESFADRLRATASMPVVIGKEGMELQPGRIHLSPGDRHMIVDPVSQQLRIIDDPPENFCKPAADPLFRSIAAAFGAGSIGIVLTGMGRDGSIGAGFIRAAGGTVIAQDPATAILPTMPQSIVDLKIATRIVPLDGLAKELSSLLLTPASRPSLTVMQN
ncbi:MAG: response regulator [Bacteroidetes bacterium]|nr:response regulator [Bacteroidota bacterium]